MRQEIRLLRLLVLATSIASLASTATAAIGPYGIDILINPYHPSVVDSWLFDINEQGQSTGYIVQNTDSGFVRNAVIYEGASAQLLPTTRSYGVNNLGDVFGYDASFAPQFIAAGASATPIVIDGNSINLFSQGSLNDLGNLLIQFFPDDPFQMPPAGFAGLALWNTSGTTPLSGLDSLYPYTNPPDPSDFLSGPSSSSYTANVTGLNNANQFAASIHLSEFDPMDPLVDDDDLYNDNFTQAYVYDGQGSYALMQQIAAGDEIRPIDIDEAGTILGWSGSELALWGSNGLLQTVLPLPSESLSESGYGGYASVQRNNLGEIVGVTAAGGVLLYDPSTNAWSDITPLIGGLGTGTFSTIQDFNDAGQFVGLVRPPAGGGVFGYVVSPVAVPEPSSVLLGIVAFVAVWLRRAPQLG